MKAVDVIIWDEASMSSRKMLELVNTLHHDLANHLGHMYPFVGKQLIIWVNSSSCSLFQTCSTKVVTCLSHLFNHVISHRFALTQVTSQSEEDQEFLKALLQNRVLPLLLEQRADTFIKEMCTAHFLL